MLMGFGLGVGGLAASGCLKAQFITRSWRRGDLKLSHPLRVPQEQLGVGSAEWWLRKGWGCVGTSGKTEPCRPPSYLLRGIL